MGKQGNGAQILLEETKGFFFVMIWSQGPALQSLKKVQIRQQDQEGSALV